MQLEPTRVYPVPQDTVVVEGRQVHPFQKFAEEQNRKEEEEEPQEEEEEVTMGLITC